MHTLIVGSNYLVINYYSSFFEMLGLENEHYTSIQVGLKRISLNNGFVNIVIILDNQDDYQNYLKQQHLLDIKQHYIIFICKTDELISKVSGRDVLVFKHIDLIENLAHPLVKHEVCSSDVLGETKSVKPEETLKHIQAMLLKNKINLPINNECAIKMLSILEDDNVSFKTIDKMSKSDPVLHSGIIKMANSTYFSGAFSNVTDLEKALVRIGVSNVKAYLISYINKSIASNKDLIFTDEIVECVNRSLITGSLCSAMAENFKVSSPVTMFSIGLMSYVGEIFMYAALSDYFSTIEFDKSTTCMYGALISNAGLIIGAKLLQKWNMADDYVLPVLNSQSLSNNKCMKETRILHLALNMHEYVREKEIDVTLESALKNTRIKLNKSAIEKIDKDAQKYLKEIMSVLN